ncbi:hypothetical protein LMG19083_04585 [Ralstonia psammae]|uniref:Uncharacterized protein n=1 Tax=Ralstonia psammae TaxID=3058598 RepID=A0ABN9JGP3_9RALS|nr:hypothetical protein [Ralstonia sp. LMG 19083]CAJ0807592.1 hypothetical protein LMG19083_04585 [Ralstonia sp. LMG 19083]
MTQTVPISTTYVVIAGAAHAQMPAHNDRDEPDVAIIGVPNRLRSGEVDEQRSNGSALDTNTRLLAQLLATQKEMLATLKAIEAKLPVSSW